jgi:hypothetical protein
MVLSALLALAIGVGIGFVVAARNRPRRGFDARKAVLAGSVIAVVRLGLFWTALALVGSTASPCDARGRHRID